jgi:hypothetical protein
MLTSVEATDQLVKAPAADASVDQGAGRGVTADQVVGLLIALVGLLIGLGSLHDNSFMTHLATGRLILDQGSVPSADPYSFTAFGEAWTVQSWGASVIFAGVEELGGYLGIRVLVGLCAAGVAWLTWRLTNATDSLVARLAIVMPVVAIGSKLWVERPLIFSLLLLLAVLFALEGRLDARLMVLVMWAWVNIHGSFPVGLLAIGAYGLGRLLDRQRPTVELRVGMWAALGTLLGGLLSPVGPKLLVFPFELLRRPEAFARVVEWQSPAWDRPWQVFFAVQLAIAVGLILLRGRRWRNVVPVALFAAMSFQSSRNIVHASLVFVPAMAAGAVNLGTISSQARSAMLRPARAVMVALGLVLVVAVVRTPNLALDDYPVQAVEQLREQGGLGPDDRLVSRDFVGNYLTFAYGPDEVRVYIDDRVDMYPVDHIAQYTSLIDPDNDYGAVLDDVGATAVIWDRETPFGDWLEDPENGWQITYRDDMWLLAVPD